MILEEGSKKFQCRLAPLRAWVLIQMYIAFASHLTTNTCGRNACWKRSMNSSNLHDILSLLIYMCVYSHWKFFTQCRPWLWWGSSFIVVFSWTLGFGEIGMTVAHKFLIVVSIYNPLLIFSFCFFDNLGWLLSTSSTYRVLLLSPHKQILLAPLLNLTMMFSKVG